MISDNGDSVVVVKADHFSFLKDHLSSTVVVGFEKWCPWHKCLNA